MCSVPDLPDEPPPPPPPARFVDEDVIRRKTSATARFGARGGGFSSTISGTAAGVLDAATLIQPRLLASAG